MFSLFCSKKIKHSFNFIIWSITLQTKGLGNRKCSYHHSVIRARAMCEDLKLVKNRYRCRNHYPGQTAMSACFVSPNYQQFLITVVWWVFDCFLRQQFSGTTKDNISSHPWILDKLITTYYDVGALLEHLIRGVLLNWVSNQWHITLAPAPCCHDITKVTL